MGKDFRPNKFRLIATMILSTVGFFSLIAQASWVPIQIPSSSKRPHSNEISTAPLQEATEAETPMVPAETSTHDLEHSPFAAEQEPLIPTENPLTIPVAPGYLGELAELLPPEGPTPEQEEELEMRVQHAKELMGKYYQNSIVRNSVENIVDPTPYVQEFTRKNLPKKWKHKSKLIAKTILEESKKYEFDPFFIMAIIENESSFVPEQIGPIGEVGLMQLRDETARWISKTILKKKYLGKKSLKNPITNIKIGVAFMNYLRERFDAHSRLYVAAYNMGATNVKRIRARQLWPRFYADRVMQRYVNFYRTLKKKNISSNTTLSRTPSSLENGDIKTVQINFPIHYNQLRH